MLFKKKIDRAFDLLKEKNNIEDSNNKLGEEEIYLEKNDYIAIILSAIIVFGPIFLVLIGIILLVIFI